MKNEHTGLKLQHEDINQFYAAIFGCENNIHPPSYVKSYGSFWAGAVGMVSRELADLSEKMASSLGSPFGVEGGDLGVRGDVCIIADMMNISEPSVHREVFQRAKEKSVVGPT